MLNLVISIAAMSNDNHDAERPYQDLMLLTLKVLNF